MNERLEQLEANANKLIDLDEDAIDDEAAQAAIDAIGVLQG